MITPMLSKVYENPNVFYIVGYYTGNSDGKGNPEIEICHHDNCKSHAELWAMENAKKYLHKKLVICRGLIGTFVSTVEVEIIEKVTVKNNN